jgi:hypothetical protein
MNPPKHFFFEIGNDGLARRVYVPDPVQDFRHGRLIHPEAGVAVPNPRGAGEWGFASGCGGHLLEENLPMSRRRISIGCS